MIRFSGDFDILNSVKLTNGQRPNQQLTLPLMTVGTSETRATGKGADNIKVTSYGLFEVAHEFFKLDGKVLIIDEIHKYKNWSQELKNIYDTFPSGKIFISGSSTLDIMKGKGDLSRRLVTYYLPGLSFREYLILKTNENWPFFSLKTILENHTSVANTVCSRERILKHFNLNSAVAEFSNPLQLFQLFVGGPHQSVNVPLGTPPSW